eukprot:597722_1
MEQAIRKANFHKLIATRDARFKWTDTGSYSLPLHSFKSIITPIPHPLSSWKQLNYNIKRPATKTNNVQHIYDTKHTSNIILSFSVNKEDKEYKFGHRKHYVSIRNIDVQNDVSSHYFMKSIRNGYISRNGYTLE